MSVERRQQQIREERKRHFELTVNLRVLTGHALSGAAFTQFTCPSSATAIAVPCMQHGHSNCRATCKPGVTPAVT